MILNRFKNGRAMYFLVPIAVLLCAPVLGPWIVAPGRPDRGALLVTMGVITLVVWLLSFAFRITLIHHAEAGIVQWSYRLFGAQYASSEVPLDQILSVGLRYWRSKYVYYQPVAALQSGKMLPVGPTESAYSLTGSNDSAPFQAARSQAQTTARSLGVPCLASDPDTSMQIIGGQVVAAPNSRQSELALNNAVFVLVAIAAVLALAAMFMKAG